MAILVSFITLCPTRARMRRISRLRPSRSTISRSVLCLCRCLTRTDVTRAGPSAKWTPLRSDCIVSGVMFPATRTA